MTPLKTPPPIAFAELPEGWLATVGATARRDGHAVRGSAGNGIEVQNINTGKFLRLMLPTGALSFATPEDRDCALIAIHTAGILVTCETA